MHYETIIDVLNIWYNNDNLVKTRFGVSPLVGGKTPAGAVCVDNLLTFKGVNHANLCSDWIASIEKSRTTTDQSKYPTSSKNEEIS